MCNQRHSFKNGCQPVQVCVSLDCVQLVCKYVQMCASGCQSVHLPNARGTKDARAAGQQCIH